MECSSLETALTYLVYAASFGIGAYGVMAIGGLLLGLWLGTSVKRGR